MSAISEESQLCWACKKKIEGHNDSNKKIHDSCRAEFFNESDYIKEHVGVIGTSSLEYIEQKWPFLMQMNTEMLEFGGNYTGLENFVKNYNIFLVIIDHQDKNADLKLDYMFQYLSICLLPSKNNKKSFYFLIKEDSESAFKIKEWIGFNQQPLHQISEMICCMDEKDIILNLSEHPELYLKKQIDTILESLRN